MQKHKRFEIPEYEDLVPSQPDKVAVCILNKKLEQKPDGTYYKTVMSSCTVFDVATGLQMDNEPMFVSAITVDPEGAYGGNSLGPRLKAIYHSLIPEHFYKAHGIAEIVAINHEDQIDAITKLKTKGFNSLVDTINIWWPEDEEFQ